MSDMSRFLDDNNIIKQEETMEFSFQDISSEEIGKELPKTVVVTDVKPSKKKQKKIVIEEEKKRKPKSERDILLDLLDKYNTQLVTKKLELEVTHFLYNDCGNNDERVIYQKTIDNLAKDIRIVEKKVQFLEKKL